MKKREITLSIIIATIMLLFTSNVNAQNRGTKLDTTITRSAIVTVGKQVWTGKDLNVDKFRNGDPIPQAKTPEEWKKAGENKQPAWSYIFNNPSLGAKYGKLYNWYAVNDPRGLAPKGWHIPTDAEWRILTNNLGGEAEAGYELIGFFGLPRGSRFSWGDFSDTDSGGSWWSATENKDSDFAVMRSLGDGGSMSRLYRYVSSKANGHYVRCVKD